MVAGSPGFKFVDGSISMHWPAQYTRRSSVKVAILIPRSRFLRGEKQGRAWKMLGEPQREESRRPREKSRGWEADELWTLQAEKEG